MATYGEAWTELHVKTDRIAPETDQALHKLGRDAEDTLGDVGDEMGDDLSKGIAHSLEGHGADMSDAIRRGLKRKKIRVTETVQFDRDNQVVRRWVKTVTDDIEDAFADASGPGGPFNRIGQGAADAIGAGFNISGRSPLILALIPLIGVIGALIGGLLQAINALAAALTTLPALLTAIGLQVGVLMLAFKGVGTAIQGAFAAKNAKELQEALKGLTQPAQEFVRALLPLKNFFKDLKMVAEANFFKFFGADVIPKIFKSLGPTLLSQIISVARELGSMFRQLALFFASPLFRDFLSKVGASTVDFLRTFGPSFLTFMKGLIELAITAMPFLSALGHILGGTLTQLGVFFSDVAKDPKTLKWFKDMQETMEDVLELFGSAIDFVFSFLAALNQVGGEQLLEALSDAFEQLAFFFSTDIGKESLKGLVNSLIILTYTFVGLLETVLTVFGVIQGEIDFFSMHLIDLAKVLEKIGLGAVIIAIGIGAFFKYIGQGIIDFFRLVYEVTLGQIRTAIALLEKLHAWFKGIGERVYKAIQDAFRNAGTWLYEQGRRLLRGFIDGIYSMLGLLRNVGSTIGRIVADYLPGSPAKEGPLAGQGYVYLRGQRMVQDFAKGIETQSPELNAVSNEMATNIVFGRDSIRVTYEGVNPTEQQARTTGYAVGSGIHEKLAVRNTRLAVRTL